MRFGFVLAFLVILSFSTLAFAGSFTVSGSVTGEMRSESAEYGGALSLYEINNNFKLDDIAKTVCKKYGGGEYVFSVNSVNTQWTRGNLFGVPSSYETVFAYCKTTADLIDYGALPREWVNSNLLLYCNDGKEIFNLNQKTDLDLISGMDIYKGCILKNMDLEEENTVFFGFVSGNPLKNPVNFNSGEEFSVFNTADGNTKDGETLVKRYHSDSTFFYVSDFKSEVGYYPLNYVFRVSDVEMAENSRVFVARSFARDKVLYGFDTKDAFNIIYLGNGAQVIDSDLCIKTLSRYERASCGLNQIVIPKTIDERTGFNLMKNIITGVAYEPLPANNFEGTENAVSLIESCINDLGNPYYDSQSKTFLCRFGRNSCPTGWSSSGHTATIGNYGIDENGLHNRNMDWEDGPGGENLPYVVGACFTGMHSFSKTSSVESCTATSYGQRAEWGLFKKKWKDATTQSGPFNAQVVEVGCVK